ncbi:hypothetical protein BMS3Bbin04_00303 [bacterium BMS3Bbin04]|nr:hypothetical protein BMS3Bbin04_00303 [bacterium BMS3Bbin04]
MKYLVVVVTVVMLVLEVKLYGSQQVHTVIHVGMALFIKISCSIQKENLGLGMIPGKIMMINTLKITFDILMRLAENLKAVIFLHMVYKVVDMNMNGRDIRNSGAVQALQWSDSTRKDAFTTLRTVSQDSNNTLMNLMECLPNQFGMIKAFNM